MCRAVEPLVVEARRGDDVDLRASGQLGQLAGVPARVARHRVDHGAQPERRRRANLGRHHLDVGEIEVRLHQDGSSAVDDEVLVRIRDPEVRGVDVAEDSPNEGHGCASGETDTTDQPPSILSSCPVTARDSSDRR